MKKTIFTFLSVFAIITSPFCQTKEYDLIDQIKNSDSSTTLVYLNATWCHPCMQKLGGIVSNFGNRPSIKLIVLFDRSGFEKYKSRLFELHDSSYFRLLPKKYYVYSKGKSFIQVYSQEKTFNRFLQDYNKQLSVNMSINELWFGHAVIIKKKTAYITKNLEENKLIAEIESKITEE